MVFAGNNNDLLIPQHVTVTMVNDDDDNDDVDNDENDVDSPLAQVFSSHWQRSPHQTK